MELFCQSYGCGLFTFGEATQYSTFGVQSQILISSSGIIRSHHGKSTACADAGLGQRCIGNFCHNWADFKVQLGRTCSVHGSSTMCLRGVRHISPFRDDAPLLPPFRWYGRLSVLYRLWLPASPPYSMSSTSQTYCQTDR